MWMVEPSFTREQLQSIEASTLIIVGDGDIVTPEHAVEMFRTIPAAQLCVVPHSGHDVMPTETILTFLQEGATGEKWLAPGTECASAPAHPAQAGHGTPAGHAPAPP